MLPDVFGFEEHHKIATFGLGYTSTRKTSNDNVVINQSNTVGNAKLVITCFDLYVLHYAPNVKQQGELSEAVLKQTPTELAFLKRSVFMEELTIQNLWRRLWENIFGFQKVYEKVNQVLSLWINFIQNIYKINRIIYTRMDYSVTFRLKTWRKKKYNFLKIFYQMI